MDDLAEFFGAPREWPIPPGADAANERTAEWAEQVRLITTEQEKKFLRENSYGQAVSVSLPRATGPVLQFAVDFVVWGFFFDDSFVPLMHEPARIASLLEDAVEVMHTPPGQLGRPLRGFEPGLADLMSRLQGVSHTWTARFQEHMKDWFAGILHKYLALARPEPIDLDTCLRIRRDDCGMPPSIDLIELATGFEIPEIVRSTPEARRMHTLVTEAIAIQNDVFSLPRDRQNRAELNTVLVLEETHGLTMEQALGQARQLYHDRVQEFTKVAKRLIDTCTVMGLTSADLERIQQFTEDLRTYFPGVCHAQLVSARYLASLEHIPEPTGPGFMPEIANLPARNLTHPLRFAMVPKSG